jgi:hypothetical protein
VRIISKIECQERNQIFNESYQQVFVQLVWRYYEHDFDDNHIDFLKEKKTKSIQMFFIIATTNDRSVNSIFFALDSPANLLLGNSLLR